MKKVFAIILSLLFFVTFSFAVVGCKKAEEQKPAEPPKVAGTGTSTCSGHLAHLAHLAHRSTWRT